MADAVASLTMQLDTLRTEVACMHGVAVGVVGAVAGARLRAAMLSSLLPTSVMEGSVDAVVATLDLLQVGDGVGVVLGNGEGIGGGDNGVHTPPPPPPPPESFLMSGSP